MASDLSLTVMDRAFPWEASDRFGFHWARVDLIATVSNWKCLKSILLKKSWMAAQCATWRKSENLVATQLLVWDIDEHHSIEGFREKLLRTDLQCLILATAHHQQAKKNRSGTVKHACDRFRVVMFLEQPLKNQQDYAWTSRQLCQSLGIRPETLDPASFSIIARWQPGKQILFEKRNGAKVKIRKAPVRKFPSEVFSNGRGVERGRLRNRTLDFLNGRQTKGWHFDLLFAAADLKSAGYSQREAIEELQRATGGKGLDRHHDLYQIRYIYVQSRFELNYLPSSAANAPRSRVSPPASLFQTQNPLAQESPGMKTENPHPEIQELSSNLFKA